MFKRILVAIDGSETSERALHEGVALAKAHRARLRLVHVVDEHRAARHPPGGLLRSARRASSSSARRGKTGSGGSKLARSAPSGA
jgi:nucleotide-binding universal stress UspA family protein